MNYILHITNAVIKRRKTSVRLVQGAFGLGHVGLCCTWFRVCFVDCAFSLGRVWFMVLLVSYMVWGAWFEAHLILEEALILVSLVISSPRVFCTTGSGTSWSVSSLSLQQGDVPPGRRGQGSLEVRGYDSQLQG